MPEAIKFNYGQAAFALFMFLMGSVGTVTLMNHSDAIAKNSQSIAEVKKDVSHLEETGLSVEAQKELCVTLAQLKDAVRQLQTEVAKLQEITQ